MLLISAVSLYRISFCLPSRASHHISRAHTRSRSTSLMSPCTEPAQNIRRRSRGQLCQSSGTWRLRKSIIMPSRAPASRCSSCLTLAISSSSSLRHRGSPSRQRTTASAQSWSISPGKSVQTPLVTGATPTSTGQKRRLPVLSCKKSLVLVVPKKTQHRGSSFT